MSGRLSRETIRRIANRWLDEAIAIEREYRLSKSWELEELDQRNEQLCHLAIEAREDLERCNFKRVEDKATQLLRREEIEIEKDSTEYREFCAALLEVEARFLNAARKVGFVSILQGQEQTQVIHPTAPPVPPSPTILEAIEKYIEFKTEGPNPWGAASRKDIPPQLKQFANLVKMGNAKLTMSDLSRDHMKGYWKKVQKLPGARTKRYKDKTLHQLLRMSIPEKDLYKPKSLETRFTAIRSFLNWCELEGYIDKAKPLNKVLEVPGGKAASKSQRRAFTEDELKRLFSPDTYKRRNLRKDWQYWLPLLGLFTGARLEELCQLSMADIREESGVWILDINDQGGDKHVKTEAGKRLVPIHPYLANELGFLAFVDSKRRRTTKRLFNDLPPDVKGKYSHAASKWFTRFRRKQNVGALEGVSDVTFHSFRHTFITRAKLLDLARYKVKEVVGHEQGEFDDVTAGYEGNYPVETLLNDVVAKIDFHDMLDLHHLEKK